MSRTGVMTPTRRLAVPGLLLALVVTGSLPAWAGAASAREDRTVCAVDAAGAADSAGAAEPGRC